MCELTRRECVTTVPEVCTEPPHPLFLYTPLHTGALVRGRQACVMVMSAFVDSKCLETTNRDGEERVTVGRAGTLHPPPNTTNTM